MKKVRKEMTEVLKIGHRWDCPFFNNAMESLEKSHCDWHGNKT